MAGDQVAVIRDELDGHELTARSLEESGRVLAADRAWLARTRDALTAADTTANCSQQARRPVRASRA